MTAENAYRVGMVAKLTGLTTQLQTGLVQGPVPVHPARRKLTSIGVQRQLPVPGDARRALHERPALALSAHPERFQPGDGQEGEIGRAHV